MTPDPINLYALVSWMSPNLINLYALVDVTKPYEFIGFGARYVTKPYEFIGFGARYVTKPYIHYDSFALVRISSLYLQAPLVTCWFRSGVLLNTRRARRTSGGLPLDVLGSVLVERLAARQAQQPLDPLVAAVHLLVPRMCTCSANRRSLGDSSLGDSLGDSRQAELDARDLLGDALEILLALLHFLDQELDVRDLLGHAC